MKIALGVLGVFMAFTLFLSIEIKGTPIFGHIYDTISPATRAAQRGIENLFDTSMNKTQKYSKRLFDNSNPKFRDTVKSSMSGVSKGKGSPAEHITREEKDQLDDLIKSHK